MDEEDEEGGEGELGVVRASGRGCDTKKDEARDEEGNTNAHVSIVAAAMVMTVTVTAGPKVNVPGVGLHARGEG